MPYCMTYNIVTQLYNKRLASSENLQKKKRLENKKTNGGRRTISMALTIRMVARDLY